MLQVNLSTLNGPELRRLLDTTRERGEAALTYQILQEMAARREGGGRRGLFQRRPAEERFIAVDLGDPMERKDELPPMPAWRAPPPPESGGSTLTPRGPTAGPPPRQSRGRKTQAAPAVTPAARPVAKVDVKPPPEPTPAPSARQSRRRKTHAAPAVPPAALPLPKADLESTLRPRLESEPRRIIWDADLEPLEDEAANSMDGGPRSAPAGQHVPSAPRRFRRGHAAGLAVGAVAGIALGWWIAAITREAPSPPAATAAPPIRTAALARRPQPAPAPVLPAATTPEPAPEAPPEPAVAAPTPALPEAPVAAPVTPNVNLKATGEAMELPQVVEPPKAKETTTAKGTTANACAARPTPADREICASPKLQRLQRELRRAYAEALQAHQDRALLRERQLAWRDARNTVSDPDRLARLYEQRIRKLNAATAEARRQR